MLGLICHLASAYWMQLDGVLWWTLVGMPRAPVTFRRWLDQVVKGHTAHVKREDKRLPRLCLTIA